MTDATESYIALRPSVDSRLSFDDAKQLMSYLAEISNNPFKLIIKSQAGSGLELYLAAPKQNIELITKRIYALSPKMALKELKKSSLIKSPSLRVNYRLKRHYAYPLNSSEPTSNDSLSTLLNNLNQLAEREIVEIELSAQTTRPLKARLLRRRLLVGQSPWLNNPTIAGFILSALWGIITFSISLLKALLYLIDPLINGQKSLNQKPSSIKVVNPKNVILLDKLYEPLFKTNLTVKIKAPSPKRAKALAKDIDLNLNGFALSSGYQQFKAKASKLGADIYSASDLAAFYHFNERDLKLGLIHIEQFKNLPTPLELRSSLSPGGIVLGKNSYQGLTNDLVLKQAARQRHLYITGATGSGKSTLLANLILQDIISGQGVSLIDPHGDLAEEVLKRIPKNRKKDVIYFNPSNLEGAIAINLLEVKSPLSSDGYKLEADQVTEAIISLFRKIFSPEDNSGHRIEYILRNCIHTALDIPGSTIFTIFRLLTDGNFRISALPNIKDQNLVNFWRNELGKAGEYQRVKMTAGVTSKIGRLLFSEPAKRVFGQQKSTLDISKLMNERKILIGNFSKGLLGEDTSKLFSTAILTKLQLAALARASLSTGERAEHYLYIDEFQNYAPSVVIQMLSEARKYGLFLTMAEQSPSQQDTQATNVILANVGNLLCFRTASPRDERLLLPNFDNYLSASDLNNLPAHDFYFKSIAEETVPPTSGRSYPLAPISEPQIKTKTRVRAESHRPLTLQPKRA